MNEHSESVKILAKGSGVVVLGMILSKVISYVYRIFIARYFGPEDYGLFSLAIALISFVSVFTFLGMKSGIIGYVSYYIKRTGKSRKYHLLHIKDNCPLSIAIAAGFFITSHSLQPGFWKSST